MKFPIEENNYTIYQIESGYIFEHKELKLKRKYDCDLDTARKKFLKSVNSYIKYGIDIHDFVEIISQPITRMISVNIHDIFYKEKDEH